MIPPLTLSGLEGRTKASKCISSTINTGYSDKNNYPSPFPSHHVGETDNNQRNGKGKILLPGGGFYEGEFRNGVYHGFGNLTTSKQTYKGYFEEGKKKGKGTLVDLVNHITYEGNFDNDEREGEGKETYEDGSVYVGSFVKGKKCGKGKLVLPNGSFYRGDFKDDKLDGKGLFKWNKEKSYYGQWNNNEICGFGILTEPNVKHIGYFDKDVKWGYGASFYFENGTTLLGKWENDCLEGYVIAFVGSYREENNEKILLMEKNHVVSSSLDSKQISLFTSSIEYKNMKEIFNTQILSELESEADLNLSE